MKIDVDKILSYSVTVVLLVLSAFYRNPWFAAASVACLAVSLAKDIVAARVAALTVKLSIPEDMKRTILDMNSRIATLEYGVKTRGF